MKRISVYWKCLAVCNILVLGLSIDAVGETNYSWISGQKLSLSIQYTKMWRNESTPENMSPMYYASYGIEAGSWELTAMGAYGRGWDIGGHTGKRWDASLSGLRSFGPFRLGVGYRFISFHRGYFSEWYWYGPEVIGGISYPIAKTGLSAVGMASVLPYVVVDYHNDYWEGHSDTAITWGSSFDVGLKYSFLQHWNAQVGFRYLRFESTQLKDNFEFITEEFYGPYAEISVLW